MVESTEHLSETSPGGWVAGFWRRPIAFLIDYLIVGLIGMLLGMLFYDWLVSLGPLARFIGLAIALAYFGVLNSEIGHGQTVAKRLLRIKVVGVDNECSGLGASLLWTGILVCR